MSCPFAAPLSSGRQQGGAGRGGGCQSSLGLIQRAPERTLLPSREGPEMQQPSRAELGEGIAVGELLPLVPILGILLSWHGAARGQGRLGPSAAVLGSRPAPNTGRSPCFPGAGRREEGPWRAGEETSAPATVPARVGPAACRCSTQPGRDGRDGARQPLHGGGQQRGLGIQPERSAQPPPEGRCQPSQLRCNRGWLPCPQGGPFLLLLSRPSMRLT